MHTRMIYLALAVALVPIAADGQQWRTIESARQLTNTEQTRVSLTFAGGKFELRPLTGALLYQMHLHYDEQSSDAVHEFDAEQHQLTLGMAKANVGWRALHSMNRDDSGNMTVGLNPTVPMALELNLGGVAADLELGGMRVKSLKLNMGLAGGNVRFSTPNPIVMDELSVDVGLGGVKFENLGNANVSQIDINGGMDGVALNFGDTVLHDVKVNAHVAFGGLKIQVPRAVGVKVQVETKLANFKPQGFTRTNDAWLTPNWNESARHVTIVVNAAFGSLEVNHSEP